MSIQISKLNKLIKLDSHKNRITKKKIEVNKRQKTVN